MTPENITTIITALITSGVVALGTMIAFLRQRKTDKVDAADKMQEIALAWTAPMEKRIADLTAELECEVEKRRDMAHRLGVVEDNFRTAMVYMHSLLLGIDRLIRQLEAAKLTPEWKPPPLPVMRDTGELRNKQDDTVQQRRRP